MAGKTESYSGTLRASHIGDMIPNDLRKSIDKSKTGADNLTGANYLTVAPGMVLQTPSGQTVGSAAEDLSAIGKHFNSTMTRELMGDSVPLPDVLLGNSVRLSLIHI